MRVKQVTYGRTVSRDFQSRRAEYTIEINEGEDANQALAIAKALTDAALGLTPSEAEINKAKEIVEAAEAAKRLTKTL